MGLVKAFDEHHAKEHGFELSEGCCMVQERKYAIVMLRESIGECGCGVAEDMRNLVSSLIETVELPWENLESTILMYASEREIQSAGSAKKAG